MTEKRFNPYKHEIKRLKTQNQDLLETNAKISIENEQLKSENKELRCTIEANSQDDYVDCLKKENEQLKQELEELKEIGDYQADRIKELQEFEDKVFDSLNDKIKKGEKAIEWGESNGADVGAMGFHIESLKQFKKELKE